MATACSEFADGSKQAQALAFSAAAGALVVVGFLVSGGRGQETPAEDPLPLHRVLIPAASVPAELERVRQGILVQLPRTDFEGRVQKAAQAARMLQDTPRLVKASYAAELEDNLLINGRADWTVINPSAGPAVLPLPDFNLAVSRIKVAESGEAILGDLDGETPGLLLEKTGRQAVFFDWSARGLAGVDGLQFNLVLPACAVSFLELKLPADHVPRISRAIGVATGPHDTEDPKKKLWRLHFTGRSQVDFTIRKSSAGADASALVLASLQTRQQITPAGVVADFEFQVEVLHGAVEELVFECDPGLQPYEVTARNLEFKKWEFTEVAAPEANLLVIRLREPFQGALTGVRVRCLSPMIADKMWTSPALRLRRSWPRGETLKIQVSPSLRLEKWDGGDFRLTGAEEAADGGQLLSLLEPGQTTGTAGRPQALLKGQGVGAHTRQASWWQIGREGSLLTSEISYELSHGKLFQLALKLPDAGKGWQVEQVALEPEGLLRHWTVTGPLLAVDLQQPLTHKTAGKVHVQLRRLSKTTSSQTWTSELPEVEPLDASTREGTLAVIVDSFFQTHLTQASAAVSPSPTEGPWGKTSPNFYFQYRNKGLAGRLAIRPQHPRLFVRCQNEVIIGPGSGALVARLELDPALGSPDRIDLLVSAPTSGTWKWRSENSANLVRSLERLPILEMLPRLLALGPRHAFGVALERPFVFPAERWRLHLTRPLARKEVIVLEASLEPEGTRQQNQGFPEPPRPADSPQGLGGVDRWEIPLVWVLSTEYQEGEVSVAAVGSELLDVRAHGLKSRKEPGGTAVPAAAGRGASFRYEHSSGELLPRLKIVSQRNPASSSIQAVVEQARLTSFVDLRGQVLHHFAFRLRNWNARALALLLPPDAVDVKGARIDGRWIALFEQRPSAEGLQVSLPVAAAAPSQLVELVYTSANPLATWPVWANLESPPPRLPITPLSFRRTWRLAPGLLPFFQSSRQVRLDPPGQKSVFPGLNTVRSLWNVGDRLVPGLESYLGQDWWLSQRQFLLTAEAGVRAKHAKEWLLGEALERLALDYLKDSFPLVLDVAAFRAAGVGARTNVPVSTPPEPFWEAAGLVYLPCKAGPVLTTRGKIQDWPEAISPQERGESIEEAVAEAILFGRDRSGRFQTVEAWLQDSSLAAPGPQVSGSGSLADFLAHNFGGDWTEWEPVHGEAVAEEILLVNQRYVRMVGVALAFLLVLSSWQMGRRLSRRWAMALLLLWLASAVLSLWWLPPTLQEIAATALATGIGVALVWYLRSFRSVQSAANPTMRKASAKLLKAGAAAVALVAALWPAQGTSQAPAADSEINTVFLLEGPPGHPEKQTALVSRELLKRLDDQARRGRERPGAVLVSASYEGKVNGSVVDFEADFQVHCFGDNPTLVIPLAGVDLKEGAFLAGVPVYPVPLPAPQVGYALPIRNLPKNKTYDLRLVFSARISSAADGDELRFTIPRLSQSQLTLTQPAAANPIRQVNGLGEQRVKATGLTAQLGRESVVHVLWGAESRSAPLAQVEVREAYLWDLRPPATSLTALLHYTIGKGAVSRISLAMPDGLAVRTVEVGTPGPTGFLRLGPRLKTWSQSGKEGNRQLHVDLASPVTGSVQVKVIMVPQLAWRRGALALNLPLPLKAKPTEGILAYRLEEPEALEKAQNLGITSLAPQIFAKVWKAADAREPGPISRAYGFRRTAAASGLNLTLVPAKGHAKQDVKWTVYREFADLSLSCDLNSSHGDLTILELEVPPTITLASVDGPAVRTWSRSGSLVQVWLQEPLKKTAVRLRGWTLHPAPKGASPVGRFSLPYVRLRDLVVSQTAVQVVPGSGLALQPEKLTNLQSSSTSTSPEKHYSAGDGPYGGVFRIAAAPVPSLTRILTTAERRDSHLHLQSRILFRPASAIAPEIKVTLSDWPDKDLHWELPPGTRRSELMGEGSMRAWKLTFPAGTPAPASVTVSGRLPLSGSTATLPGIDVELEGPLDRQRWLALVGGELWPGESQGLRPVKDVAEELSPWPSEVGRVRRQGSAWFIRDTDRRLAVEVRPSQTAHLQRPLLVEQEACVADGKGWLHQARLLLNPGEKDDLRLLLPEGASLLWAEVDGTLLRQPPAGSREIIISPTRASAARSARIFWSFPPEKELPDQPNLSPLSITGMGEDEVLIRVLIPPGFQLDPSREPLWAADVELLVRRARAEYGASAHWAEQHETSGNRTSDARLLEAQQRFFALARRAEYRLALDSRIEKNPRMETLAHAILELRRDNHQLGRRFHLEKLQSKAEKLSFGAAGLEKDQPPSFSADTGQPVFVKSPSTGVGAYLPLKSVAALRVAEGVFASQLLLVAFVAVWIASNFSGSGDLLRSLWPEQAFLLALLGWYVFGLSLLGLVLALFALVSRLALMMAGLQSWFVRHGPGQESTRGDANPAAE
jgi:hypothetical protein